MHEVDYDSELIDFNSDCGDYEEYLLELGELQHKPLHGPRADHVGENVFAFEWETLNATVRRRTDPPNALLASILFDMQRRITQRHASVAASFITWLGTNCGHSFLDKAYRMMGSKLRPDEAFIAAWTIDNKRMHRINGGIRLIESILAPADHFGADLFSGHWGLRRMPDLTIEDHEAIDHLVAWLATARAEEFLRRCQHLIKIRERYATPMDTVRLIVGAK